MPGHLHDGIDTDWNLPEHKLKTLVQKTGCIERVHVEGLWDRGATI